MIKLGQKITGGALQFVLLIGTLIALLLAALVLLTYSHNFFKIKTDLTILSLKHADNSIAFALKSNMKPKDSLKVPIVGDLSTATVVSEYWGVFEKLTTVIRTKKIKIVKSVLVGGQEQFTKRNALYLQDINRPLVVVGNTKIIGNSRLPKQRVRTGNISGISYYGSSLIYGKIGTSQNKLPAMGNFFEKLH